MAREIRSLLLVAALIAIGWASIHDQRTQRSQTEFCAARQGQVVPATERAATGPFVCRLPNGRTMNLP
jgi:putative hemolysin